jgi:hypothetical protein
MTLLNDFVGANSLFNICNEHVTMFTIEEGEKIELGDCVVVNTRTLLARKAKAESGYFSVGVAKRIIDLADGNQAVICIDGIHVVYDHDRNICENDIGRACYFADAESVTLDNINKTRAGIIMDAYTRSDPKDVEDGCDRIVYVKINVKDGSDLKW